MSEHRYVITAGNERAEIEFSERAELVVIRFHGRSIQVRSDEAGGKLVGMMREAGFGVEKSSMILVAVEDAPEDLIASIHPMLSGARVTWLVLFRANGSGNCFRSLGNGQRLSDALALAVLELKRNVLLPHKP